MDNREGVTAIIASVPEAESGSKRGNANANANANGNGNVTGDGAHDGGLGGAQREVAQRAWETEKKLRRRVEALERRLDERGIELHAAEGQTAKAKDLLSRYVYVCLASASSQSFCRLLESEAPLGENSRCGKILRSKELEEVLCRQLSLVVCLTPEMEALRTCGDVIFFQLSREADRSSLSVTSYSANPISASCVVPSKVMIHAA